MKLGKKIRYIILPVILMVCCTASVIYYKIYQNYTIENKLISLDRELNNLLLRLSYKFSYSKSYLKQKVDSKEATLIFNALEMNNELPAPYITQFLNLFFNATNEQNSESFVHDLIIFNIDQEVIVHANTQDPFATPILRDQTAEIFAQIKDVTTQDKKLAPYYYFIDLATNKTNFSFYIIKVFSPYQLTSKAFYDKSDDIYLVQAEINSNTYENALMEMAKKHNGFLTYQFINNSNVISELSLSSSPFKMNKSGAYEGHLNSPLFDTVFTLDKKHFDEEFNKLISKILLINLILISLSYFIIVSIIDKQIIHPITNLAKSIKAIDVSSTKNLVPLNSKDEVADLNASYIAMLTKINDLAKNDPLTGLSNRGCFNTTLLSTVEKTSEDGSYIALFFIDLDNFKQVNDTFGHAMGDQLLIVFSQRLKKTLRKNVRSEDGTTKPEMINSIARLGGDEFVILINNLPSIAAIESIGQRICDLFKNGFCINENVFDVHASIGISYTDKKLNNAEELLNQADDAMYLAKNEGKNKFKLFSSSLVEEQKNEKQIECALNHAQINDDLFFVYHPIFNASTRELKGYELLLRCPELMKRGIGPDIFIPIAEKSELILTLDLWVVEQAFIKLDELIKEINFTGVLSINVSPKSMRNKIYHEIVSGLIEHYPINLKQIELEITETCLLPNDKQAINSLNQLKSLGLLLALDDFGTGYTSFRQLIEYPLDKLKIDRSFVQELSKTELGKKPALDLIFELAKIYHLEVVIQGIESESNLQHALAIGCDTVQGHYLSNNKTWQDIMSEQS